MKTRIPDYFDAFHCLAGDCPDTCCGAWDIVVDAAAEARYRAVEGPLGQKLRSALTTGGGETRMVLEHGKCPLLTAEGLCPIVSELGEDFLSTTCHTHPRFTEVYGGYEETALSVSCPEAARLLLTGQEPLTFRTETDDRPPEPNDLDADLFFLLLDARETAEVILRERSRPLSDRLALLLCFAHRLDAHYDDAPLCRSISRLYREEAYRQRQLVRIRRHRRDGTLIPVRQVFNAMEHLTAEFPAHLREREWVSPDRYAVPLERLCVYFLSRWWLKAACDGYIWRHCAAIVVSVLTVAALARTTGDVELAARLYSKEVEHSEENLRLLRRAMELPQFTLNQLLRLTRKEDIHAI